VDLIESYGRLAYNLDFYTDLYDLKGLLRYLHRRPLEPGDSGSGNGSGAGDDDEARGDELGESPFLRRHRRLNEAVCELVEDFGLVSFETLNISDAESVRRVLAQVDKANGYLLCGHEEAEAQGGFFRDLLAHAFDAAPADRRVRDVQERYMPREGTAEAHQDPA
jgi:GPN-loop GTPase